MRRRGGSDIGTALQRVVRSMDRSGGSGLLNARVADLWPQAAGPVIAAHTAKAFVRRGELNVYVDSPVWATELSAMSEELRRRLNEALGKEAVRSVRFTVSSAATRPAQGPEDPSAPGYGPGADGAGVDRVTPVALDEDEIREVEESVAGIGDEALREAAIRATVRQLEWSKGLKAASAPQGPRDGARGPEQGV